jgi:pimeloyl-ACP methyl ester carboxylesterase
MLLIGCSIEDLFLDPNSYKRAFPYEFYVYPPSKNTEDTYRPIFVFIPDVGDKEMTCWNSFQKSADKEGYILVCPTFSEIIGSWSTGEVESILSDILNQVRHEYSVQERIFLSGFGSGGLFALDYAYDYPRDVAGVSAIAPGGHYLPTSLPPHIQFYIMVGDQDYPSTIAGSKQLAENLKSFGNDVQYFEITGVGHQLVRREIEFTLELFRSIF